MGALFGFSGSRDEHLLERQDRALSHRGTGRRVDRQGRSGTLACRPRDELQGGVAAEGAVSLAFIGLLRDPRTPVEIDAAAHLLQLYREEGLEFLGKVRGAWVLAIQDGETLHLARDGP